MHDVKPGVNVTVFSDNVCNKLHASDVSDFRTEFPGVNVTFIQTMRTVHDRFIVLDCKTDDERVFHCGASSKDAGKRMTVISEFEDGILKKGVQGVIKGLSGNPGLVLK